MSSWIRRAGSLVLFSTTWLAVAGVVTACSPSAPSTRVAPDDDAPGTRRPGEARPVGR